MTVLGHIYMAYLTGNARGRSLLNRDLEDELVPACRELGIGIVAYSPLCRSLLSGKLNTPSPPPRYPLVISICNIYGRRVCEGVWGVSAAQARWRRSQS
jgi:hypothetical protein